MVRPDALLISPSATTPEGFETAEVAIARVLQVLSHTPIGGIGHNFEFRDAAPAPEEVAVFTGSRQDVADRMPAGWTPAGATIASTFKNEAETVQVNIQRQWDGGALSVKFNFHHAISSVEQAVSVLRGTGEYTRMAGSLELARRLVQSLYGGTPNA